MNISKGHAQKKCSVALIASEQNSRHFVFLRVGDFVQAKTLKLQELYQSILGIGPYQVTSLTTIEYVGTVLFVRSHDGDVVPINSHFMYRVPDREMTRPLTYEEMVLYFEHRPEFAIFRNNPKEIRRVINEYDVFLEYSTYLDTATDTIRSRFYSEHIVQEMIHVRTFLARYVGLPTGLPTPAVTC